MRGSRARLRVGRGLRGVACQLMGACPRNEPATPWALRRAARARAVLLRPAAAALTPSGPPWG
eukprot:12925025-Alexandrium_andersonii.AAC.1